MWILVPHVPHVLAEGLLVLVAFVAPLTHEFRDALLLAALAAYLIEVTFIETERLRRRGDRTNAAAAASSAARSLLDARLSEPDLAAFPIGIDRRVVTLRSIGTGDRLDLEGHNVRTELSGVRERLHSLRGIFAASVGSQMPFLEPQDQRAGVVALRELDSGMVALAEGMDAAWRRDVISSSGVRGEALQQFENAHLEPALVAFHDATRKVAMAVGTLERATRIAWAAAPIRVPTQVREAARLVAASLVESVIAHGVRINWYSESALAGVEDVTMRTFVEIDEVSFAGQARLHGWSSLQEYLRHEEQALADGLEAIADGLDSTERAALQTFREEVASASRAADAAAEATRRADDAPAEQLLAEERARADAAVPQADRAFVEQVRRALAAADAALRLLR